MTDSCGCVRRGGWRAGFCWARGLTEGLAGTGFAEGVEAGLAVGFDAGFAAGVEAAGTAFGEEGQGA